MKNSKSFYALLFLISNFILIKAQHSSFIYELKYKPLIKDSITEKIIFYLDTKYTKSVFRSDKFRISDSLAAKRGWGEGFDMEYNNKQLYVLKNLEKNQIYKYIFVPLVHSIYSIRIEDQFHWTVLEDKMKIGDYNCQKAKVEYGGRIWTAWFTNEITVQDGPYVFHGLPGLIVKISDENSDYDFELIEISDFKWKELYPPKSQKQISWKDFQKLQRTFYSDPLVMINKSEIKTYDESGNIIKTDIKEMKKNIQNRIREKNNPIELNYILDYENYKY